MLVGDVNVRAMKPADWTAVRDIYLAGIATRNATFETTAPSWERWDASHLPDHRLVAEVDGAVVGWATLAPMSDRCAYIGVAENSVYIHPAHRGNGIGRILSARSWTEPTPPASGRSRPASSPRTPPASPSTRPAAFASSAPGNASVSSTASGGTSCSSSAAVPTMVDLETSPETGTGTLRLDLPRRLTAEALGTGLLVVAVIGSGIMASRLSPTDTGLQLLENAAATAAAVIGLILMFSAVSGAHFNPIVTLVDRSFGSITTRDTGLYIAAQVSGGCLGAVIANLMFEEPAVEWSTTVRSSGALWLSEIVATMGLLLVIHGCVRTGRASAVPFAVGLWIGGAYWFTSSTSFANPAVTIARTLSDTFAGIKPTSAPMFIAAQLVGAVVAVVLIRFFYPSEVAHA